ncbi:hypothetical protein T439DRAFT_337658 [Meredithblackwellia eburnea MCA 4105]
MSLKNLLHLDTRGLQDLLLTRVAKVAYIHDCIKNKRLFYTWSIEGRHYGSSAEHMPDSPDSEFFVPDPARIARAQQQFEQARLDFYQSVESVSLHNVFINTDIWMALDWVQTLEQTMREQLFSEDRLRLLRYSTFQDGSPGQILFALLEPPADWLLEQLEDRLPFEHQFLSEYQTLIRHSKEFCKKGVTLVHETKQHSVPRCFDGMFKMKPSHFELTKMLPWFGYIVLFFHHWSGSSKAAEALVSV